jgi:hypothetical protein
MKGVMRMRTQFLARLGPLALAALTAMAVVPGMAHAQQRPDLKIEHGGWWDPNDDRGILLRVTNVGTARASAGKANVQTLSPGPANVDEPSYPALDPGKSFAFKYQLAAPCDGHVVKAGVSATADGEQEYGNNFFQGPVCAAKPKPSGPPSSQSGGVVVAKPVGDVAEAPPSADTKIDTGLVLLPEHMQPGARRLQLEAVKRRLATKTWDNPPLIPGPGAGLCREGLVQQDALVGFYHRDSDDCYYAQVMQVSMRFELGDLRRLVHFLKRATFEFDEEIVVQRGPDGGPASLFTCVGYVGLLTADPEGRRGLYPHEEDVRTDGFRSVEVTGQVRRLIANPEHDFGFMVGGLNEGNAEDEEACVSSVGFPRLILEYDVLGLR